MPSSDYNFATKSSVLRGVGCCDNLCTYVTCVTTYAPCFLPPHTRTYHFLDAAGYYDCCKHWLLSWSPECCCYSKRPHRSSWRLCMSSFFVLPACFILSFLSWLLPPCTPLGVMLSALQSDWIPFLALTSSLRLFPIAPSSSSQLC